MFTDIEGSTRLARQLGGRWHDVVEEHNRLLRLAIRDAGGLELRTEGDAFFAVFTSALAAVAAATTAQQTIAEDSWPQPVRVRMGLHTGEGIPGGDEYVGLDVHRAARIAAAAHGGQVLLSEATKVLVGDSLPEGVGVRDLGQHRLKDIPGPTRLYDLIIEGLPSEFPAPRTLEVPTNLPAPLTSFVGRGHELEKVTQLLRHHRLLTLTGPGGTGKTRVALEAATRSIKGFADGVFFVDIAPITDAELVVSTIASAAGVREQAGRSLVDTITDHLRDRRVLLLLDNFEQVLDAAPLVEGLLADARAIQFLVTSRAPLRIAGEQEFPVPPLRLPGPGALSSVDELSQNESVALFIHRATAVESDFALTRENAAVLAEICSRLDGLPLAIELAASRVRVLTPRAMLDRMHYALPLLAGRSRSLPERQRTLRATIEWSYDLLDEADRALFRRLSTFVGGWSLEAAEAVADPLGEMGIDILTGVESLIDHSLVLRQDGERQELRFGMLETIREYGLGQLEAAGEADKIRSRHAAYYLSLAEEAEPRLTGPESSRWLDVLSREHDNLRAALRWALDSGQAETGMRTAGALWRFWQLRGHLAEGRRWAENLLGMGEATGPTLGRGKALGAAGSLAYWQADLESAGRHYQESLEIYRELGDRPGIADALYNLGFVHGAMAEPHVSEQLLLEAQEIFEKLGDERRAAYAEMGLSLPKFQEGDLEASMAHVEMARATFLRLDERWGLRTATGILATQAMLLGNDADARALVMDSLEISFALQDSLGLAVALDMTAALAAKAGRHDVALRLAGTSERLKETAGGEAPGALLMLGDPRETARSVLQEEEIVRVIDLGKLMTDEEAVSLARKELLGSGQT
jgi:predicted ATPase/class 3 adenylate cyclase